MREILGLDARYGLRRFERARGPRARPALADRVPIPGAPVALASRRLGLPATHVYRKAARTRGSDAERVPAVAG